MGFDIFCFPLHKPISLSDLPCDLDALPKIKKESLYRKLYKSIEKCRNRRISRKIGRQLAELLPILYQTMEENKDKNEENNDTNNTDENRCDYIGRHMSSLDEAREQERLLQLAEESDASRNHILVSTNSNQISQRTHRANENWVISRTPEQSPPSSLTDINNPVDYSEQSTATDPITPTMTPPIRNFKSPSNRRTKRTSFAICDRYTGVRYRTINDKIVRISSTRNMYQHCKPQAVRTLREPTHCTRSELTKNDNVGAAFITNRRNDLKYKFSKCLDPSQLYFEDPNENWCIYGDLDSGMNGTVKVARHRTFHNSSTVYAVKRMKTIPYYLDAEEIHRLILTEIDIMRANHPNMIGIQYAYLFDDTVTMFMKKQVCCVGTLLETTVERLSEADALYIIFEAIKGLEFMHNTLHYLHGDLKPDNILIGYEGQVMLADFGLSAPTQIAWNGPFFGTKAYMAPELKRKHSTFNEKSDIYSLAKSLIELLTFNDVPTQPYNYELEYEQHHLHYLDSNRISNVLKDILRKMLDYNPCYRPDILTLQETFRRHFSSGILERSRAENILYLLRQAQLVQ